MNWDQIFQNVNDTLHNLDWLQERSKEELIQIVQILASKTSGNSTVATISKLPAGYKFNIPDRDISTITEFEPAPANSVGLGVIEPWQIVLYTENPSHLPLALEIMDDLVIGRSSPESQTDLDLSLFGASKLGVSRVHASIRPSGNQLLLFDLGSANGTSHNFEPVAEGTAAALHDGDVISFSLLHLKIKIVRPGS